MTVFKKIILGAVGGLIIPLLVLAHGPQPVGSVNDFAGLLTPATVAALEGQLKNLEAQTGAEVAVAIIPSLPGETIEDYAVNLFEEWGLGKKKEENGVLLLISRDDRQARIEVGYGLEPIITDGQAGEIIRQTIVPNFQAQKYNEGVTAAVAALENLIRGSATEPAVTAAGKKTIRLLFGDLLFIPLFLLTYISSFLARSKSFWLGGVLGATLGGGLSLLAVNGLTSLFFAGAGGVLGLLFDYVLSKNYQNNLARGRPTDFWHTYGGFGRGGGGFGGFGGGRSGGGGASSSW